MRPGGGRRDDRARDLRRPSTDPLTVTPSAKLLILARQLLPERAWDGLVGLFYPRSAGG